MEIVNRKLNKKFGIKELYPFQQKVIEAYLRQKDILVFVMTGGGKSLCYQLPAVLNKKLVIVISPLKSLMQDQVNDLNSKNIKSCVFSGDQSYKEKNAVLTGLKQKEIPWQILYTNPETLNYNSNFLDVIKSLHKKKKLSMVVFDEAHCLSLWGHDFRPSYLSMARLKDQLTNVPFMALTASATPRVEAEIKHLLKMDQETEYIKESFRRKNLNLIVIGIKGKSSYQDILEKVKHKYRGQSGIIYCHSRKKCEKVAELLQNNDIKVSFYHAGMNAKKRKEVQEKWKSGEIPIVIATIAFGMGINKKDVRFVIHCNIPKSIENYYQEIGRAGRDGEPSDCLLYYNYADKIVQQKLIFRNKPKNEKDKEYQKHQIEKINDMVSFVENVNDCRHYLLSNYFGESKRFQCLNKCQNCKNQAMVENINITELCKSIFDIVAKYDVSRTRIKAILNGKNKEMIQHKLTTPITDVLIDRVLIYLITHRYIKEKLILTNNNLWYEKLYLYKKCQSIIKDDKQLSISVIKTNTLEKYFCQEKTQIIKKKKIKNLKTKSKSKTQLDINPLIINTNQHKYVAYVSFYGWKNIVLQSKMDSIQKKVASSEKNYQYWLTVISDTSPKSCDTSSVEEDLTPELNSELYQMLVEKRNQIAKEKQLPGYCVLHNKILEKVATYYPETDDELLTIKGIGNTKVKQYGKMLIESVLRFTK